MKLQSILLLILIASCRPTEVLQQGKTKFYQDSDLNKIAVVAFPGRLLDVRAFENAVVRKLSSNEVEVVAGHQLYQDQEEIPVDIPSIREDLKKKGFKGMIEIKLVSIRNVESEAEDNSTNREYRLMDVANYSKLVQEYGKREEKEAVFEDVKVKMDFRVVDLTQNDTQVIWSARTESTNPNSTKKIAQGVSKKAVKVLKKEEILNL